MYFVETPKNKGILFPLKMEVKFPLVPSPVGERVISVPRKRTQWTRFRPSSDYKT